MYDGDTFFHLSLTGRIGLVLISAMMEALALWGCWRLTRWARWPSRLLGALGIYVVFEWLAPQVHYLWYMMVIDGLPLQWVIGPLPRPGVVWEIMGFQAPASLSAHARAVLGWACVLTALLAGRHGQDGPPRPYH